MEKGFFNKGNMVYEWLKPIANVCSVYVKPKLDSL